MSTSGDLERLAAARFALLSKGEIKMLHAAAKGTIAFCGPSQNDDDPENDPANSDNWSADRQIRSDLLSWLCIDDAATDCVDPKGIQLHGALISGALDLSFADVNFPLRLYRCRLSDDWNLNYIQIPSIQLSGTWLRSLTADVARVTGSVFLKAAVSTGKVQLRGAHIGRNIDCSGSKLRNPGNEQIPDSGIALNAEGAKVEGFVFLRANFSAEGEVRLFNAEIGANLNCIGSKFQNSANPVIHGSGIALNAEGATIGGHVLLRNFSSDGEVRLSNAKIGGNLECDGSQFQNPVVAATPGSGIALHAEGTKVGRHVLLNNNCLPRGEVRLFNAEIGGSLDCGGSKFQNPATAGIPGSGIALNGTGVKLTGSVFLRPGFSAEGEVRLFNAQIGGNLDCGGSKFQNPANAKIPGSGIALNAESAKVTGSVFARYDFSAEGEVVFFNAVIGGDLDCGRGKFLNPGDPAIPGSGIALNAVGANVGGSVFLRWDFSADGAVRLFGAEIGRSIDCGGGKIQNPANPAIPSSGVALDAEIIKVGGPVTLNNNFLTKGEVRLFNAKIVGDLDCAGGKFDNPVNEKIPGSGIALEATGINIHGSLFLEKQFSAVGMVKLANARITGSLKCSNAAFETLDLIDASAGSLMDDKASWPRAGKLFLDGFVYGRISGLPVETKERLKWLELQSSFARQPYRQLATILGNAGDDLGARSVLCEMQREAWQQRRQPVRLISLLLWLTIGYGYFPLRAIWLILLLVAFGSGVYWMAYKTGSIVPTQKEAYGSFESNCDVPKEYERFHAIPYSLENSFPLVKLGIQDKWAPAPEMSLTKCWSKDLTYPIPRAFSTPGFLRWFRWGQVCVGWILTTLFVAGVTGILRKN